MKRRCFAKIARFATGAEAGGKQLEERVVPSLRHGDVETKSEQEIYKPNR